MQEFLVILACMSSKGCETTANAYYQSHPELKHAVQTSEEKLKKIVGPTVVAYSAPAFFLAQGGSGTFKLYGDFSLQVDKYQNGMLIFSKGF